MFDEEKKESKWWDPAEGGGMMYLDDVKDPSGGRMLHTKEGYWSQDKQSGSWNLYDRPGGSVLRSTNPYGGSVQKSVDPVKDAESFISQGFKEGDTVTKDGKQFRIDPTGLTPIFDQTTTSEFGEPELKEGEKTALEKIADKETEFLTSEETDMDKFFEERKKSIEAQKAAGAGSAGSEFARRIATEEAAFETKKEDVLAGLRGVGPATYNAVVSRLEKEHKLVINDLMSRKEEALANFNNGLAERYDNLIIKQYEFQQTARKNAFDRVMDVTREQREQEKLKLPDEQEVDTFTDEQGFRVTTFYNKKTGKTREVKSKTKAATKKDEDGFTAYQKYEIDRNANKDEKEVIKDFFVEMNRARDTLEFYADPAKAGTSILTTKKQLIQRLQAQFPDIDAADIVSQVNIYYPDIEDTE